MTALVLAPGQTVAAVLRRCFKGGGDEIRKKRGLDSCVSFVLLPIKLPHVSSTTDLPARRTRKVLEQDGQGRGICR